MIAWGFTIVLLLAGLAMRTYLTQSATAPAAADAISHLAWLIGPALFWVFVQWMFFSSPDQKTTTPVDRQEAVRQSARHSREGWHYNFNIGLFLTLVGTLALYMRHG